MTKQTIVHKGEAVTYRGQLVGFYDEIKGELELDERLAHIEVILEDNYDHWIIIPSADLDLAMKSTYVNVDEATSKLEAVTNGLEFDELTESLASRQRIQEAMNRSDYIGREQDLVLAACQYLGSQL